MWKINRILWNIIGIISLIVFISVSITDGLVEGKAYMLLLTALPALYINLATLKNKFSASQKRN